MTSEVGAYMAGGIVIAIVGDIIIVGCWAVVSKESNTLQKKSFMFLRQEGEYRPSLLLVESKMVVKKKKVKTRWSPLCLLLSCLR